MLIFFNDPLPCEDAPQRAARLASRCATRCGLVPKWQRRGHRLGFGVGMAQGYATLGRIGFEDRFDYTAIGAVINLAARLCAEAADGQVLASGRLASMVEDLVADRGSRRARAQGHGPPGRGRQPGGIEDVEAQAAQ
jgi:class 3 adenylate cyclase